MKALTRNGRIVVSRDEYKKGMFKYFLYTEYCPESGKTYYRSIRK